VTGFIKPLRRLEKKNPLNVANPAYQIGESLTPEMPTPPEQPRAPTIDDAVRARQDQDRLRRRRGVLANIYGGASGGSPKVGTASVLGG
jgi:hypothetical protein